MKNYLLPITLFILMILNVSLYAQGAFDGYLKRQGQTDLVLSYTHEHYDTYKFGNEARLESNTTYTGSFFLASGLSSDRTLVLSIPYISLNGEVEGIQDAILGIKKQISSNISGDWTVRKLAALGVSFPLSNYDTDVATPIGQKAVTLQPRGILQADHRSGAFVMVQPGLDFRMFPDFQVGAAAIGRVGYAGARIYFDVWADYFHTFEQGVDLSIGAGQGSSWFKAGFNLYTPLAKGFGLIAGGGKLFYGRNIGLAWNLRGGIVYSITKKGS
jgi:hypothetical protein